MPELVTKWPIWYLGLAGYCLWLAVIAFRYFLTVHRALAASEVERQTASERAHAAGYRTAVFSWVILWMLGVVGLLLGVQWLRALLAFALVLSARRSFSEYATGFAGGRKSVELAAAPEYVMGRVKPKAPDYAVAAVYVGITKILPLMVVIYSMLAL
jgi:hypothetical protein